jgi:exopolyphosphatase/guanosine-5'-triphosphate,3'-diphosphate pyrophosphatase
MRILHVRKDRAEVIGIAGIVLAALGQWLNQKRFLIPGVGVKEGILIDLVHSLSDSRRARENAERARDLLASVRRYAARFDWDSGHAEKVREIAASLFLQLRPLHGMGPQAGLVLEMAALLQNVGSAVHRKLDYQHSEYLVRNGEIAGLGDNRRNLVASIIRYSSELSPDADQKFFSTFSRKRQWQICSLASILRVAEALDADHAQAVTGLRTRLNGQKLHIGVRMKRRSELVLWTAARRATLFEGVFDRKTVFKELPPR